MNRLSFIIIALILLMFTYVFFEHEGNTHPLIFSFAGGMAASLVVFALPKDEIF